MPYSFKTLTSFKSALDETICVSKKGVLDLQCGLALAVKELLKIKKQKKNVFFIGNGGSAAISSHQALDLWNHSGVKAFSFNDPALLTGISNDYGFENVFSRPLEEFCAKGDLLIAISSSGRSKNILNGVKVAQKLGCRVIGFSGFKKDNPLSLLSDLSFYVPSSSYGIVETAHFLLTHAIIDQVAKVKKDPKKHLPLHSDLATMLKRENGRMELLKSLELQGETSSPHNLNS